MQALMMSLQNRHAELERQLKDELASARPNDAEIARLTRLRLHVRDRIASTWRGHSQLSRRSA